jgi:16S rRNA (adenine1518-N6/adenine1519-N6)-dimethyltransferase
MPRARRSLGQHFLMDPNLQRNIVAALDASLADTVLEIGPGTGALTRHLAGSVAHLVAVEIDARCAEQLERELGGVPGVRIIHGDALDLDLEADPGDVANLKVIGNIPYFITTPLIFWLLDRPVRPARIVLTVQREVADRLLAEPGSKDYGALTVGVRSVARVERLFQVSRSAFRPVPDVDSSVVRITPMKPPALSEPEERDVRALSRVAFSRRRKQLQKILRSAPEYGLDRTSLEAVQQETGIELERRPETLSPPEFARLARALRHDPATDAAERPASHARRRR